QVVPTCADPVGKDRHNERARNRSCVQQAKQGAGARLTPAVLDVGVRKPGVQAVERSTHEREHTHESPGDAAAPRKLRWPRRRALVRTLMASEEEPSRKQAEGKSGEEGEGAAPTTKQYGERNNKSRRECRAEVETGRIDASRERWPVGEALLDGNRKQRARKR